MGYGVVVLPNRGKGSEKIWQRTVADPTAAGGTRRLVTTVTCHGTNYELGWGLISAVRRRLWLDPAHGVPDSVFFP